MAVIVAELVGVTQLLFLAKTINIYPLSLYSFCSYDDRGENGGVWNLSGRSMSKQSAFRDIIRKDMLAKLLYSINPH